ncbi:MAG: hypothetical protein ABSE82_14205 [Nitrososphaerales archaeon]|jgi:hypothetical protein
MVQDQNPKFTRWNLRPFPEDIKRECNVRAAKEGKKDWRWLADYLRKVLPIVETSDINSTHESRQGSVRRSSPPDAKQVTKEKRKDKG